VKTTVRNPLESEGNNILRGGAAAHDVCGDVHIASIGSNPSDFCGCNFAATFDFSGDDHREEHRA
jgi:hypothetical protein